MQDLVIIGAGGFGREVLWLISEINEHTPTWNVLGFLDDNPNALNGFDVSAKVISAPDEFADWDNVMAICAIGYPDIRRRVVARLNEKNVNWANVIHPTAFFGTGSTFGVGCVFSRGSGVTVNCRLGDHVQFNIGAGAGHDSVIGSFSTFASHADITGNVTVGEGIFLGCHTVVLPGGNIGDNATVGAGAVVLKQVPANATAVGVPAKVKE